MIDMHSHILPMVDDGSRSVKETFNMLKEAHKNGFTAIVCTPHYFQGYYESEKAQNQLLVDTLNKNIKDNWNDFNLYLGNEVFLTNEFADLFKAHKATSMNQSKYVLFEFSLNDRPMSLIELIEEIIDCGFTPILAHPERYSFVKENPDILNSIISEGVLLQCNYGSIIGQYGEKSRLIMKKLLKYDMVSFLGTDCHRQDTIYSKINECTKEINKIIDPDKFKEITETNPTKVINNENIEFKQPHEFKFTFSEKIIVG